MGSWETEMADRKVSLALIGVEFRDRWHVDDIGVMDDGCCSASCEAQPFLTFSLNLLASS